MMTHTIARPAQLEGIQPLVGQYILEADAFFEELTKKVQATLQAPAPHGEGHCKSFEIEFKVKRPLAQLKDDYRRAASARAGFAELPDDLLDKHLERAIKAWLTVVCKDEDRPPGPH